MTENSSLVDQSKSSRTIILDGSTKTSTCTRYPFKRIRKCGYALPLTEMELLQK